MQGVFCGNYTFHHWHTRLLEIDDFMQLLSFIW